MDHPDPLTAKQCSQCQQQVYPREIRSDGTCKACARRQYYLSRKDLLAERYKNNREARLLKQKEYYIRKKETKASNPAKSTSTRRRVSAASNGNQPAQEAQSFQQSGEQSNGQSSSSALIDSQPSSSSTNGLDILGGASTLVKISYPFTTTSTETVITQPMPPFNVAQVPQIITWEMLQQSSQQNSGPL
ncbi:hypothetical protein M3Y97_00749600 [Aphelenchoides bicaudatus]|nr:hypothetical protein M3Y97_00749600 [Aphelenchoides bicaudatus]